MKRRKFLKFTVLAAAAAGTAGAGYVYLQGFDRLAARIILEDTASLDIAQEELDKFFQDVREKRTWDWLLTGMQQQLVKWHYYMDNAIFHLPYKTNYTVYRSKIVGMFLLSTDYFQNKMDPGTPIRYVALFDPYFRPCSNPFSNLYYPEPV